MFQLRIKGINSYNEYEKGNLVITKEGLVKKLNYRGYNVTIKHYKDWLSYGEDHRIFDKVVRKILSKDEYDSFSRISKLDACLKWVLGVGPKYVDGVDLSNVYFYLPKHSIALVDNKLRRVVNKRWPCSLKVSIRRDKKYCRVIQG